MGSGSRRASRTDRNAERSILYVESHRHRRPESRRPHAHASRACGTGERGQGQELGYRAGRVSGGRDHPRSRHGQERRRLRRRSAPSGQPVACVGVRSEQVERHHRRIGRQDGRRRLRQRRTGERRCVQGLR